MKLRDWITPTWSPTPRRFNEKSADVLGQFGNPAPDVADQLLAEAERAYDAARDRADSAERRAGTIQGAIAIATSLTFAGGSLLLDTGKARPGWLWPLGVLFTSSVVCFGVAGWRSFLVTWPRYMWATPASEDIYLHAAGLTAAQIKTARAADLLVAYGRNDEIAAVKIELLGSAARWLIGALALVATLATVLAADAVTAHESSKPRTTCSLTFRISTSVPQRGRTPQRNAGRAPTQKVHARCTE